MLIHHNPIGKDPATRGGGSLRGVTPRYYTIVYISVGTSKPPLSIFCQILENLSARRAGGVSPLIIPATQERLALQDGIAAL